LGTCSNGGLEVARKETALRILDDAGKRLWQLAPSPDERDRARNVALRHYCSVVTQYPLIYKGIVSSDMVRRQILSAYEPRI
jgi:hypothetical protein